MDNGLGGDAQLAGHELLERRLSGAREPQHRGEVLLAVEHEPFLVHLAVEMNGELRDAKPRVVQADEARLEALADAEHDPTREPQVAIEPRVEQGAAVHLDAELQVPFLLVLRARLEPEVRAVGMRTDDAKATYAADRSHEGDERAVLVHDVVAPRGERVPVVALQERSEPRPPQARRSRIDGVVRGGGSLEVSDEVEGRVHACRCLARARASGPEGCGARRRAHLRQPATDPDPRDGVRQAPRPQSLRRSHRDLSAPQGSDRSLPALAQLSRATSVISTSTLSSGQPRVSTATRVTSRTKARFWSVVRPESSSR